MAAQLRPNRLDVTDRFPMLGFTIRTDSPPRVAEAPGAEVALHHELVDAVRAEGDEDPAEEAGPEGVRLGRVEREVEGAELAGGAGVGEGAGEAARQLRDQEGEGEDRAAEVDPELDELGPDDRLHAADHGVEDHHRAHAGDRPGDREAGHLREHQRGEEEADAVGEGAGDDEEERRGALGRPAEAAGRWLSFFSTDR